MTPEQLVQEIQAALPNVLRSAVLYGSAVAGDFVPGTSNYNVLLVLERLGTAELNALSKPAQRWSRAGNRTPLLFTPGQLQASADAFPIELNDLLQARRVLFGEDPLAGLAVSKDHLRLQLERELKGKLLALREHYLLTGAKPRLVVQLMTASVAGFLVLFRAALRLFQADVPAEKAEAARLLAEHLAFDPQPLLEIDELRRGQRKPRDVAAAVLFESYLTTIKKVVEAVDRHKRPQA